MSTTQEIAQAIHSLDNQEVQKLARLMDEECRSRGIQIEWPKPRDFSPEQVESWLREDAADAKALRTKLA